MAVRTDRGARSCVGAKGHQLRGTRATSVCPTDLYWTKQHLKQQQAYIIHFMYVNDILVSCVMVQKLDNLSVPFWVCPQSGSAPVSFTMLL